MKKIGITFRMGAGIRSITTEDGHVFDLLAMDRKNQHKTRRLVVGAFRKLQNS